MDDNDNLDDNQHDGEMVGLHNPANGRSCVAHECCGRHLVVGDLVRFKREILRIDYAGPGAAEPNFRYETVLKVVVIRDGVESCHVGFLPRHVVARSQEVNRLHGKFAQVLELYDDDDDVAHVRKKKSIRNHGMELWGEPTNHPGTGSYFFNVPTPPIIIIEIIITTISY